MLSVTFNWTFNDIIQYLDSVLCLQKYEFAIKTLVKTLLIWIPEADVINFARLEFTSTKDSPADS